MLCPKKLCEFAEIQPGMKVGDFGCGAHGALVHRAAEIVGEEGKIYAVDVQPHLLSLVARGHTTQTPSRPIETIWSDIEQYGATAIPHESLDRIFLIQVILHLQDLVAALKECSRLLSSNGKILVADWAHTEHPLAPAEIIMPETVARAAGESNLRAGDLFPASDHHWGMMFFKV